MNAEATLAARAENDRNVQRAYIIHGRLLSDQRSLDADARNRVATLHQSTRRQKVGSVRSTSQPPRR